MKKLIFLVCSLVMLSCAVCSAAKPTKHVYFFYKIQDEFLEIQDDGGNLKKGTLAFEKILKDSMKERFIVDGMKRIPYNSNPSGAEYLKQVKESQIPYIRSVKVTGYKEALQNGGVGANGKKLPITISCEDFIVDRTDKKLYGVPSGYDYFNSPMIKDDVKIASAADVKRVTKEKLNEAMYDIAVPPSKYIEQKQFPDVYNSYSKVFAGDYKAVNNSIPNIKAGDSKTVVKADSKKSSKTTVKADSKKSSKLSKAEKDRLKAEEMAKEKLAKAQVAQAKAAKEAAQAKLVQQSKPAVSTSKSAASTAKTASKSTTKSAANTKATGKVVVSNRPTRRG